MTWFESLQQALGPETWVVWGGHLVRVALILAAALIINRIAARLIPKLRGHVVLVMSRQAVGREAELGKRADTLSGIASGTVSTLLVALALVMALKELGFDVTPILAGAGVVGLAVGFGAQNLVRDVMTGLVMLVENQLRVGDVANINGIGGVVERVGLRTTILRDLSGTVHVIPNGVVSVVSNLTRDFSYYVFETGVAYKEDTDRVVAVLREIGDELRQVPDFRDVMLEPLEVLGVDSFGDSAVIIKSRIKTLPSKQWMVGREMNRRIKKRFDAEGIEIPFPHRTLYFGEVSPPFRVEQAEPKQEEVRTP